MALGQSQPRAAHVVLSFFGNASEIPNFRKRAKHHQNSTKKQATFRGETRALLVRWLVRQQLPIR
jgi:hypothetical protein